MTHKSHIEQLIQDMCPNGVKYMPLGEVCRSIAAPKKLQKKDYQTSGLYPIIDQGKAYIIGYTDDQTALLPKNDYVLFGDHTREIKFVNFAFAQGADGLKILLAKHNALPRYLYYCLLNLSIPSRGYNRHWSIVSELSIPLPPVAIQEEIVRILDAFANLIENIDTEIKERERQLDCALNALFDCNIPTKTLGEIGGFYRGNGLQKKDFVERGIGCIHYGQIYTKFSTSAKETLTYVPEQLAKKLLKVHTGNLIIACTGENIEDLCKSVVWMGKEDIVIGGHSVVFRHTQDPLYIAYYFQSPLFAKQKVKYIIGAKVSDIKAENIAKINIPLPPLAEQRAIAEKLDTIEAFINNLKTERDLRQQQYEYYREHLINLLK